MNPILRISSAVFCAGIILMLASCERSAPVTSTAPSQTIPPQPKPEARATIGSIERIDAGLDDLLASDAVIEVLAEGFQWSEGPVWFDGNPGFVLFSDVPANTMYRWSESDGLSVFMKPSGYDGPPTGDFREPGTNGLLRGWRPGTLLAADHGNRAIVEIDLNTRARTVLADRYDGKRFSSPNDLVLADGQIIYFTDPPYGLNGIDDSPLKEQPQNGVYRRAADGQVDLVVSDLSKPNGIGLSPDQRTLYVANSDPDRAIYMAYALNEDGLIASERLFFDATDRAKQGLPGLPDGMVIDARGNLFATGPGGVLVFSAEGKLLGCIHTGTGIANVTFGGDGSSLYITANDKLVRVATRTHAL